LFGFDAYFNTHFNDIGMAQCKLVTLTTRVRLLLSGHYSELGNVSKERELAHE